MKVRHLLKVTNATLLMQENDQLKAVSKENIILQRTDDMMRGAGTCGGG